MENNVRKNPWLGLESYREGEVIYGRDDDIRDLSQSVLNDTETLLYGKSGIGKSSILNAGILPAARRAGFLPVIIRLSHKGEVPYLEQLCQALQDNGVHCRELVPPKDKTSEGFYEFFHRHIFCNSEGERVKLLIIFDQFEEIFTLQENLSIKKGFFESMADQLNDILPGYLQEMVDVSGHDGLQVVESDDINEVFADLNLGVEQNVADYVHDNEIHFIFTIREDFLSEFEYYSATIPSLKQNRYGLRPISEEQASQIILRPVPGLIDKSVARLIIEKVTGRNDFDLDGYAEIEVDSALLSLYLNRLYEAKEGDTITAELIEHKGSEIIADFYDEAVSAISASSVEYFETVLLNGQGRRDNVTVYDALNIGNVTQHEINVLCDKKILRCFNYAGNFRLEFIHDILCPVVIKHREQIDLDKQKALLNQEKKKNRKRLFSMLMLLAVAAGIVTFLYRSVNRLDDLNNELVLQQQKILRSQQKLLSVKIKQLQDNGDSYLARRLALNVLSLEHAEGVEHTSASFKSVLREISNANTAVLKPHNSAVEDVAFSPVEPLLASVSDTAIFLWNTTNGMLVKKLSDPDDKMSCVAFSSDGAYIAAGMYSGAIKVYSRETGQEVLAMQEKHKGRVRYVTYISDDARIVSASTDKSIVFWNPADGSRVKTMPDVHVDEVLYLAFSNDCRRMASASADKTIAVWDIKADTLVTYLRGHEDWVRSVSFNPADNNYLLSASDDGRIGLWNIETGEGSEFHLANSIVTRALYSPDAKNIVASYRDGSVRVWDAETQTESTHLQGTHNTSYVNAVAISPDCSMFASAGSDNVARLWDLKSPLRTAQYPLVDGNLLHVSARGDYIVVMVGDEKDQNMVACYDARKLDQGPIWTDIIKGKKFRHSVINPDRNLVAVVGYGTILIRDLLTGEIINRNDECHKGWIYSIASSPDGQYMVSAGFDKSIKIWDWELNPVKQRFDCHDKLICSVGFSLDGKRIVSASADCTCKVWNVDEFINQESIVPIVLKGHQSDVMSAVFSRDGRNVLSASRDKTAKLWDVDSVQCIKTFVGHGGMVNAAVFSADEDEVVTASSDKIVRVWSVQTEKELIGLYGHKESVTAIAADSKVSTIYTVSHDGTLQVWDYPSLTDVIQDIRRRFGRYPLTDEELIELDVI